MLCAWLCKDASRYKAFWCILIRDLSSVVVIGKKRVYKTRDLARADVFDYIESFYNRTRRHQHIGGVSPEAFETASF